MEEIKKLSLMFDDGLFNALVEKIEVISPMHLLFILKTDMILDEYIRKGNVNVGF